MRLTSDDLILAAKIARERERERCAKIADTWREWSEPITVLRPHEQIAAAIRKDEP